MGTTAEFELWVGERAEEAWAQYAESKRLERETQQLAWTTGKGQDAVTAMRWLSAFAALWSGSRGGAAAAVHGDTIGPDGGPVDRFAQPLGRELRPVQAADIARSLGRGSRFRRCQADGTAKLADDSVVQLEYLMAHQTVSNGASVRTATGMRAHEHVMRRLELEENLWMEALARYSGLNRLAAGALTAGESSMSLATAHQQKSGSPLLLALAAGRPVLVKEGKA